MTTFFELLSEGPCPEKSFFGSIPQEFPRNSYRVLLLATDDVVGGLAAALEAAGGVGDIFSCVAPKSPENR